MASNKEIRLQQAITDFQTNRYPSIRAAARANDVHHTTLSRRLKGRVSRRIARQPQQLLSEIQEQLLVQWILDLEAQGHAPSFTAVRDLAGVVSRDSGGPNNVGKNWISRFLKRHPEIRSKVGRRISAKRANSTSPEAIAIWF